MLNKHIKTAALLIASIFIFTAPVLAFDGGGSFYDSSEETSAEISGEIEPEFRIFSDNGDINENLLGDLKISYPGSTHEFNLLLDYQIGAAEEIEFNRANYKYYGENYSVLLGKEVVIWGKGDKVHVVDNINGKDLSDFINPDYKERQIGEEMIKIDRYFRGGNANLEFIYTPGFTPNRMAKDPDSSLGNWIINPFGSQLSMGLDQIAAATGQTQEAVIEKVEDSFADEDNQFALRFTDSRGGTDYGFSYYRGYLRNPSYNPAVLANVKNTSFPAADIAENKEIFNNTLDQADLHYDEVDVFGFEMAKVIATINSRFELAYYRTDDTDGNNPAVRNNKIAWVIGGDRDLPLSNLNLNLQFTGEKILDDDQIENNISQGKADLQYNSDGDYTTHRAILKLEDSYQNEKIIPQLTWVYNFAESDYSLELEVDYELRQNLNLNFAHKIFNGDSNTTFGQFEDNDFSSISLNYSF